MRRASPSTTASADARLADEHGRVRALAVAEDLHHLSDLVVPADDGGELVLARELVEAHAEVLEVGGQLVAAAVTLLTLFVLAHAGRDLLEDDLRLGAELLEDLDGGAVSILEQRVEKIRGFDSPAPAWRDRSSAFFRRMRSESLIEAAPEVLAARAGCRATRRRSADRFQALHEIVEETASSSESATNVLGGNRLWIALPRLVVGALMRRCPPSENLSWYISKSIIEVSRTVMTPGRPRQSTAQKHTTSCSLPAGRRLSRPPAHGRAFEFPKDTRPAILRVTDALSAS